MIRTLFILLLLSKTALMLIAEASKIKNIVVLLADDHAIKATGAYGNAQIRTPHIDRLAASGVTFTNSYCNAPICSASRQSLLTAKYPHATGVNLLFTPFPDEGNITIAEHLRDQGYATALIGKDHWNNWMWASLYKDGLPDHGFDLKITNGEYRRYYQTLEHPEIKVETYNRQEALKDDAERINWRVLPHPVTDAQSRGVYFVNQAIDFMDQNQDKPFFLWLSFYDPHAPFHFPLEFAGKYKGEDMTLPPTSPEDDRWVPERFRDLTEEQRKGVKAAYYTSTEYMDKNIGLLLDALDERNLSENTLVIYLSDNGYLLNEHKRFEKHTMWEEAIQQPMIIRVGQSYRENAREDALIEYIDVVPTLLDIMDLPPMQEAQGRSFRKVFEGKQDEFRKYAMSTYLEDNLTMVTDGRWKYVYTTGSRDLGIGYRTGLGPTGIVHRLYDLRNDPNELKSVAADHPERVEKMQKVMLERFMQTHPDAEDCPDTLTLVGKLAWFCEPRDIGVDQTLYDDPVRVFNAAF